MFLIGSLVAVGILFVAGKMAIDAWGENRMAEAVRQQLTECDDDLKKGMVLLGLLGQGIARWQTDGSKAPLRATTRVVAEFYEEDPERQGHFEKAATELQENFMPVVRKLCPGILPPPPPVPTSGSPAPAA